VYTARPGGGAKNNHEIINSQLGAAKKLRMLKLANLAIMTKLKRQKYDLRSMKLMMALQR